MIVVGFGSIAHTTHHDHGALALLHRAKDSRRRVIHN